MAQLFALEEFADGSPPPQNRLFPGFAPTGKERRLRSNTEVVSAIDLMAFVVIFPPLKGFFWQNLDIKQAIFSQRCKKTSKIWFNVFGHLPICDACEAD
jgi:hypothetical protein